MQGHLQGIRRCLDTKVDAADARDRVSASVLTGSQDSDTSFTDSSNSCWRKLQENAVLHTRVAGCCHVVHCPCGYLLQVEMSHLAGASRSRYQPSGSRLGCRCGFDSHRFREEVSGLSRVAARVRLTASAGRTANLPRLDPHARLHHPVVKRCLQVHLWQRTMTSSRALPCTLLAWCSDQHLHRSRNILQVGHSN